MLEMTCNKICYPVVNYITVNNNTHMETSKLKKKQLIGQHCQLVKMTILRVNKLTFFKFIRQIFSRSITELKTVQQLT